MLKIMLENANKAKHQVKLLATEKKNKVINEIADRLIEKKEDIKKANKVDLDLAHKAGLSNALIDRLTLSDQRIEAMARGAREIALYQDPIGQVVDAFTMYNGIEIEKVLVPLGLIAMIYESRPNVTIDASVLALKAGNAIILRGSANAFESNLALANIIEDTLVSNNLDKGIIQLVKTKDRSFVDKLIRANDYIDVLIPRGGKGLKSYINAHATIPVIETGSGICHIYLDDIIDAKKVNDIIINAKVQRPGVCNAVECLLFNKNLDISIIESLTEELLNKGVEVRYDGQVIEALKASSYPNVDKIILAGLEDFPHEYLDLVIAGKFVENVDEAINYINNNSSHHSDSILSQDIERANKFLRSVDSAVVYHNASTRFSDGGEFGLGGEIGISTQKLHARGPMGVKELTTYKYIARGKGQVRQ